MAYKLLVITCLERQPAFLQIADKDKLWKTLELSLPIASDLSVFTSLHLDHGFRSRSFDLYVQIPEFRSRDLNLPVDFESKFLS